MTYQIGAIDARIVAFCWLAELLFSILDGMERRIQPPVPGRRLVRILILADTHLGFDLPSRPRIVRRRRGYDFFDNFERALQPALCGEADLVVHGGDLLYRSRVPASLVQRAMQPLMRIAERGVPVFVVPGNHERSRIPYPLLTRHRNVHVFDRPRTFVVACSDVRVAMTGFPYDPEIGRTTLTRRLATSGWQGADADVKLLCMHQLVEGARVEGYTFRRGPDVIASRSIPSGFAAVLSGHIHRSQVLTLDQRGRGLAAPVVYPGSIERTSFAERNERKGFMRLALAPGPPEGGTLVSWTFDELPARPMVDLQLGPMFRTTHDPLGVLHRRLASLDPNSIVRLRVDGQTSTATVDELTAVTLRTIAPPTMNVSLMFESGARERWRRSSA